MPTTCVYTVPSSGSPLIVSREPGDIPLSDSELLDGRGKLFEDTVLPWDVRVIGTSGKCRAGEAVPSVCWAPADSVRRVRLPGVSEDVWLVLVV